MAYPILLLLIYSNVSVPPPISLRPIPPSSLKPELVHPPSICVVKQYNNSYDKYLKGYSEEDLLESDPEIDLDLDPEFNFTSDYESVPPSFYFSSSSSLLLQQPQRWWFSKSLTWALPGLHCHLRRLLIPPSRPLCHLFGVIVFIIAIS